MDVLRRLALAGASLLLALGLAELFLRATLPFHPAGWFERVADEDVYYLPTPSVRYRVDGLSYTHDALGMRDLVERDPGHAGRPRAVLVGDSICYGVGVDDGRTAAAVLEELLPEVEVLNLGVAGHNAHQVAAVLRTRGAAFGGVRWVVYLLHENDVVNATFANADVFLPARLFELYEKPGPAWRRLLKQSFLALQVHRVLAARRPAEADPSLLDPATPPTSIGAPFDVYRRLLLSRGPYHARLRENLAAIAAFGGPGVRKLLVHVPSVYTLHADPEREVARELEHLAGEVGLEFLAGDTVLGGADVPLYHDPGHPNAEGHARLAQALADWIRSGEPAQGDAP